MHIRGHVKFSYSMTDSEDTFVETVLGDLLAFFHHNYSRSRAAGCIKRVC